MSLKIVPSLYLVFTVAALGAAPTLADDKAPDAWGAPEDTEKCAKELAEGPDQIGSWINFGKRVNGKYVDDGKVHEPTAASDDCRAEVAKRAAQCLKDPTMAKHLKPNNEDSSYYSGILKKAGDDGPRLICAGEAFTRLIAQRKRYLYEKQFAEKRKADAEQAELPKVGKKDAGIESAIAATFKANFPDARFIKVILISSDWSTDRNDYGVVVGRYRQAAVIDQQKGDDLCEIYSEAWEQEYLGGAFKGPMHEGGAGSLERTPIVCSKTK
jgi:hypothetical protein